MGNSKHKESLSSDNWFSDESDNAKSERLPELSTMVGSLKNGDTDSLFKNQKINGENSDSDSSEDDNIIGPMPPSSQVPPKRKSNSDDEDDDILGSSNIGTIGKVKTAVTLKLKPISISLKTSFDKKKDDNSEGKLDSEKLNSEEKL